MRRILPALVLLCILIGGTPAGAAISDYPTYTGDQFQELYDFAVRNTLPRLTQSTTTAPVTGNAEVDGRIWDIALRRGYRLRPVASGSLSTVDGVPMQPEAARAWERLEAAARDAGLQFIVSSAYRSPASQRTQFLSKLSGTSNDAIAAALTWYSVPGTSKHHSGYALDFRYRDGTFGDFRKTPDYAWLSMDNFYNAKRFGFIPSYPDDVSAQGPNPEPWEFVWVDERLIRCGTPVEARLIGPTTGPASAIVAEVARCPGKIIVAGEAVEGLPTWWHRIR